MASPGSKFEDFSSELQATNPLGVKQSAGQVTSGLRDKSCLLPALAPCWTRKPAGSGLEFEVNTCLPVEHCPSGALPQDVNDVLTITQQPDISM